MIEKRRRRTRQRIEVEELKQERASLLSWGKEDATLLKLETYRLYEAGDCPHRLDQEHGTECRLSGRDP